MVHIQSIEQIGDVLDVWFHAGVCVCVAQNCLLKRKSMTPESHVRNARTSYRFYFSIHIFTLKTHSKLVCDRKSRESGAIKIQRLCSPRKSISFAGNVSAIGLFLYLCSRICEHEEKIVHIHTYTHIHVHSTHLRLIHVRKFESVRHTFLRKTIFSPYIVSISIRATVVAWRQWWDRVCFAAFISNEKNDVTVWHRMGDAAISLFSLFLRRVFCFFFHSADNTLPLDGRNKKKTEFENRNSSKYEIKILQPNEWSCETLYAFSLVWLRFCLSFDENIRRKLISRYVCAKRVNKLEQKFSGQNRLWTKFGHT